MNKKLLTAGFLLWAFAAMAQEAPTQEVAPQAAPPKEEPKLTTGINGRLYYDGTAFFDDVTPLRSGTGFSDVRIGFKAKYGKWDGKVDIGFANNKVSVKDVFSQYNFTGTSYVRAGHYAEPIGLDNMESSSNMKFIPQNASTQAFTPGRRMGIEYIGWNKTLWYAAGVWGNTAVPLDDAKEFKDTKGNSGYAVTGRLVFNPLQEAGRIAHIGAAATFRGADPTGYEPKDDPTKGVKEGDDMPRSFKFSSKGNNVISGTNFISSSVSDAENQVKFAVELIGAYGPVFLQGEYMQAIVNRKSGLKSYNANGAYVQVGYLVTGGDYTYSAAWARMATPKPGSLEFAARYNYTNLNDTKSDLVQKEDKLGINGGTMSDITVAANYYLNKYVVFKLNYSNIALDEHSNLGSEKKENINLIDARIQVVF